MNKNLIVLTILSSLYFGCSKTDKSGNSPQSNASQVKIELVSGGNQTDTAGNRLQDPIVVEVTVNGVATSGYTVQFQAPGCDQDNTISTPSGPSGTTQYNWALESVGQQTMKAYVLNSGNQKADSVSVSATGLQPGPGWHNSACSLQGSSSAVALCELSTGRLFTCYGGEKTYLRYSDDNGLTWNAVKSLGNSHTITDVFSSPSDEVFVLTEGNDGTFYSNDAGQTWSNLGVPPFNTEIFYAVVCTPSGKLIAASAAPPLCISVDKGKTWASVPSTAFVPQNSGCGYPSEDAEGNLYVVGQSGNIFKSADAGSSWNIVTETGNNSPGDVFSLYIDNNNWFYKSTVQFQPGLYISKDNGSTYSFLMHSTPDLGFANMSRQSDGNFYYEDLTNGLYSYDGTSSKLIYAYVGSFPQPYIVAKNNNIIFANEGQGYIRYYSK